MKGKKVITAIDKRDGSIVKVVRMFHRISGHYYSTVEEPHKSFFPNDLEFDMEKCRIPLNKLKGILLEAIQKSGVTFCPYMPLKSTELLMGEIKKILFDKKI